MPITLDQPVAATVVVTTDQTIQADHLWIDRMLIDGSGRNATPPTAEMTITPYAVVNNVPVFASEPKLSKTANVYAAAANIPEIGAAILANFAATKAWHVYELARQADLDNATAALESATIAQATAQATLDGTATARNAAFAARSSPTDPAWLSADTAWQAATTALATATTAVATAQANVTIATAAVADPANPKL